MEPAPDEPIGTSRPASPLRPAWIVLIGGLGGIVGALLGGGTGVVAVPLLARHTTLRRVVIHGTATITNCAVAVVGSVLLFWRGGHVDPASGCGLMIGGVTGALIGARVAARASDRALRVAFALVLALAGVELLLGAAGWGPSSTSPLLPAAITSQLWAVVITGIVLGVTVGAWSAAMGLGGGSLTVPILVLLFGLNPHTAEGTSLLVMLPNSLVASVQHLRQRTALPRLGLQLAAGAAPGAVIGVALSLALPARGLSIVFGLFLLVISAREAMTMRATAKTEGRVAKP